MKPGATAYLPSEEDFRAACLRVQAERDEGTERASLSRTIRKLERICGRLG